jgi:hypothetical protein
MSTKAVVVAEESKKTTDFGKLDHFDHKRKSEALSHAVREEN